MAMAIPKAMLVKIYRDMVRSRVLDEKMVEFEHAGKMVAVHSGIGEEGLCGVYSQLRPDDYCGYTHRGCYVWVAKGMNMREIMAEKFKKFTGCAKGKGDTHIVCMELGILGRSGMQGGHFPLFAGAAKSIKLRGGDQIAACSFGEGCATSGLLHEALNQVAVHKLPVLYVCDTNHFMESLRTEWVWAQTDISKMAIPYNIPSAIVDGNDAIAVAEAAQQAIAHTRSGQGPYFLELKTFRIRGHHEREPEGLGYRTRAEVESWKKKDPIPRMADTLLDWGVLTATDVKRIRAEAEAEVEDAVRFAEASPEPPDEELYTDIYAE
jgi:acetoin:2,6-dichlorophenolindophenol oxidoreductase subunit alpha